MGKPIYLLLGSNQGDRQQNIAQARQAISRQVGRIVTSSALYQTKAWGITEQPDFYNQVIQVESRLTPQAGMGALLKIEQSLGRQRKEKWGPRTIDIDILFWKNEIITTPELTIPHPAIAMRRFTLVPLNEIASGYAHPLLQKTVTELLQECTDKSGVEKLN